jgi:hypothetical protein
MIGKPSSPVRREAAAHARDRPEGGPTDRRCGRGAPRKFVADHDDATAIHERIGQLLHRAVSE